MINEYKLALQKKEIFVIITLGIILAILSVFSTRNISNNNIEHLPSNVIYGKVITEWPLDWRSIETDEAETMVYSQMWDWGIITADEAIIECYKEIYESIMLLEADS